MFAILTHLTPQPRLRHFVEWAWIGIFLLSCAGVGYFAFGPPPEGLGPGEDKIQHGLTFFVLTILGVRAFPRVGVAGVAVGLCAGGVGIEIIQGLPLVHRDADLADVGADVIGVVAAVFLLGALFGAWALVRRIVSRARD